MFPIRSDLWFSASTEDGGCTVTVSAGTEIHRAHPVPWLSMLFLFIVFLSIYAGPLYSVLLYRVPYLPL